MLKAIIFDCFGVFYPDPVFTYMRDPQTSSDKAEALHALDEQAARGKLTKANFIKQAGELLNKSFQKIEMQFFQRHNNNQELIDFIKRHERNIKQHY